MARFKMRTRICLTAAVAIAPLVIAGFIHSGRLEAEAQAAQLERLQERVGLAAGLIEARLGALFHHMQVLAGSLDLSDPERLSRELALLAGASPEYLSIAVADPAGRLLAATQGSPEGEEVSLRPWFREGLQQPWASDFDPAEPLPSHLTSAPLVQLAAPVRSGERPVAVLGAYVGASWVQDLLAGASTHRIDLILVDHLGRILSGPEKPDVLQAVLGASMQGRSASAVATAPGGQEYLFVSVPGLRLAPGRALGFSLIGLEPAQPALARTRALVRSFWVMMAAAAGSALIAMFAVAQHMAAPFVRLAAFAQSLADRPSGALPPEEKGSIEAFELSAALARLQSALRTQALARSEARSGSSELGYVLSASSRG